MIKLRIFGLVGTLLLSSLCGNSCKVASGKSNKETEHSSIVNTTWFGVDSDGDFYEYTFLESGKVSYRTNTSRKDTIQFTDKEDVWLQHNSAIVILLGNTSVQSGIIGNNVMRGKAWNVNGKRWTWQVKKRLKQ